MHRERLAHLEDTAQDRNDRKTLIPACGMEGPNVQRLPQVIQAKQSIWPCLHGVVPNLAKREAAV